MTGLHLQHLRDIARHFLLIPQISIARILFSPVAIERTGSIVTVEAVQCTWQAKVWNVLRTAHVEDACVHEQRIELALGRL